MFVWQKNGVVRVIKNGQLLPTPFIDLSAKVNTFDDRGLLGSGVRSALRQQRLRLHDLHVRERAAIRTTQGPKTSRLTRVTANPANPDVALPGSETVILGSIGTPPCSAQPAGADCIRPDGGSPHARRSLHFAPTARCSSASATAPTVTADLAARPGPQQLERQDPAHQHGRTAPSDNPFYDGTNSIRSKVWLYGVRNPFRFAIQPGTGEIYFGDVGWNTWEEVNRGVKGGNYGWPCYEGNGPQPFFQTHSRVQQLCPDRSGHAAVLHLRPQRRLRRDRRAVLHGTAYPHAVPRQLLLRRLLGQLDPARRVRRQPQPGRRPDRSPPTSQPRCRSRSAPTG